MPCALKSGPLKLSSLCVPIFILVLLPPWSSWKMPGGPSAYIRRGVKAFLLLPLTPAPLPPALTPTSTPVPSLHMARSSSHFFLRSWIIRPSSIFLPSTQRTSPQLVSYNSLPWIYLSVASSCVCIT